ncbi:hypothetical protein FQZ97_1008230 [compost metagenome]
MAEGPGFALVELVEAHHGYGLDFDRRVDAGAIVGQADEAERPVQVAADHAVQFVDVLGAVLLAPFDAQHIDRLHESPLSVALRGRTTCQPQCTRQFIPAQAPNPVGARAFASARRGSGFAGPRAWSPGGKPRSGAGGTT